MSPASGAGLEHLCLALLIFLCPFPSLGLKVRRIKVDLIFPRKALVCVQASGSVAGPTKLG